MIEEARHDVKAKKRHKELLDIFSSTLYNAARAVASLVVKITEDSPGPAAILRPLRDVLEQ